MVTSFSDLCRTIASRKSKQDDGEKLGCQIDNRGSNGSGCNPPLFDVVTMGERKPTLEKLLS